VKDRRDWSSDVCSSDLPEGVVVTLPGTAPDPVCSVVVLTIAGAPEIEAQPLAQAADGTLTLPAGEAACHGQQVKLESSGKKDNIGYWLDPADWIEWQFKVTAPGTFEVTAEIAAQGSGSFTIEVCGKKLEAKAPVTGDYTKYQAVTLGQIEIPAAGKATLAVRAVADGWKPFNLRALNLKPVK
jgi:alpha-L-fucosidase